MTLNELKAALETYAEAGRKRDAAYAVFENARKHFFAIQGKVSKADYAAFGAAQKTYNAARDEFDVAYAIACELPTKKECSDYVAPGDDSAEQLNLF